MRIILENLILFLLPALLYVGYVTIVRKTGQSPREVMDDAPIAALLGAGITLIAATLLVFGLRDAADEGRAGQAYEPSAYKDGKLIPGRVK